MLALKEEFIDRFMEIHIHKVRQELKEKLPGVDFLVNMQLQAKEIISNLTKEER